MPLMVALPPIRNSFCNRMSTRWSEGRSKLLRSTSVPSARTRPPVEPSLNASKPEDGVVRPLSAKK
jgi:hypothetical protein